MNGNTDSNASALAGGYDPPADWAYDHNSSPRSADLRRRIGPQQAESRAIGRMTSPSLDMWPLVEALLRRWSWILAGGVALALLGWLGGLRYLKTRYTAVAQLVRYESQNAEEVFRPRQLSPQTFANLMRSPELLQRVGALAQPPISPDALAGLARVSPERNSEVVIIVLTGNERQAVVDLVNLYAREAVRFLQEMQAREATEVNKYVTGQLAQIDEETRALYEKLRTVARTGAQTSARPTLAKRMLIERLSEKLLTAREELAELQGRYQDAHPSVQQQCAKLAEIEKQINGLTGTGASATSSQEGDPAASTVTRSERTSGAIQLSEEVPDSEVLVSKLQTLETGRLALAARQRAAQLFEEHPAGYFRLLAPATADNVAVHDRRLKVMLLAALAGLMGACGFAGLIALVEFMDDRLKTAGDIKRVTRLPVVATLGDLQQMDPAAQRDWAFRTWTALQSHLSHSSNHGLICGVTSSRHGEGRSTWVDLLAQAASESGFRVVTIGTRPTVASPEAPDKASENAAEEKSDTTQLARLRNLLEAPHRVTQTLAGPNPPPRVHIPMPGWVWSLERRKQWQSALNQWRRIDNIVIFVELPPASVPEAVLLAENLPNLIWLAEGRRATAVETQKQLQTLRQARCNLVGAVLNRESAVPLQNRFPRWLGCLTLFLGLNFRAMEAAQTPLALSVVPRAPRTVWQPLLRPGSNDVPDFSLCKEAKLARLH